MYKVETQQFSGPLDLLLQLIEAQKMKITEISLSQVTDQFLARIEQIKEREPESITDFLAVGARLLLLKSRALLPYLEEDEEDDLEKQLKIYKEFLDASKKVNKIFLNTRTSFAREKLVVFREILFVKPENLVAKDLTNAFWLVVERWKSFKKLPKVMIDQEVSLQQQIMVFKDLLDKKKQLDLVDVLDKTKNKTEVIVNFLALLELAKSHYLKIKQNKVFDKITIEKL